MTRISISKEALEKLSNNSLSEYEISVLERFLPENQLSKSKPKPAKKEEPAIPLKTLTKPNKKMSPSEKKKARRKRALQKYNNNEPLTKKEEKELMRSGRISKRMLAQHNLTIAKKKNYIGNIREHRFPKEVAIGEASTFFYAPKRRKTNSVPHNTPSSRSSGELKFIFDNNNLAEEYEVRSVEFGHGRKKSQEWNDKVAKTFQKDLKKRYQKNSDWTDRFALK